MWGRLKDTVVKRVNYLSNASSLGLRKIALFLQRQILQVVYANLRLYIKGPIKTFLLRILYYIVAPLD